MVRSVVEPPSPVRAQQLNSIRSGALTSVLLPADGSTLVGRAAAVRRAADSLAPGRVVTLTGTGGVGKTSVALDVARTVLDENEHFTDGIWFCAMAGVDSEAAIPVAIADCVGMVPTDEATPYDSVVTGLSGLWGVLIVDNCEQILRPMAKVLHQLSIDCPDLAILATSREPLRLPTEELVHVAPLDIEGAAEELFVRRATEADPHFSRLGQDAAIHRICASLDGLPLALELAAAHLGSMPLDELASRLDERFRMLRRPNEAGRNDSLHATVSWSYELLEPVERRLFDRLSVFEGGFDGRAAASMLDARDRDHVDIGDLLGKLVDKSMINVIGHDDAGTGAGHRYDMLETLRQFGDRQLGRQHQRAGARTQHLDLVVELVASANSYAMSNDWLEGVRRFRLEWANIRAAVNWAIDTTRSDDVDRLLRDVHFYCRWSLESEAALWAQRAIERGKTTGARAGAPAFLHVGFQHFLAGDHEAALEALTAGLAASATPSDRGWCRHYAAVELLYLGRAADAANQAAEDIDDGSPRNVEAVMRSSSITAFGVYAQVIDGEAAAAQSRRDAELAQRTGNAVAIGHVMYNRALIAYSCGDVETYLVQMNQAIALARVHDIANLLGYVYTAQVYAPGRSGLSAALDALDYWTKERNIGNEYVVLEAVGINLAELGRLEPAAMILGNLRSGRRMVASSRRRREAALGEIALHEQGATWMKSGATMSRIELLAFARQTLVDTL